MHWVVASTCHTCPPSTMTPCARPAQCVSPCCLWQELLAHAAGLHRDSSMLHTAVNSGRTGICLGRVYAEATAHAPTQSVSDHNHRRNTTSIQPFTMPVSWLRWTEGNIHSTSILHLAATCMLEAAAPHFQIHSRASQATCTTKARSSDHALTNSASPCRLGRPNFISQQGGMGPPCSAHPEPTMPLP